MLLYVSTKISHQCTLRINGLFNPSLLNHIILVKALVGPNLKYAQGWNKANLLGID